jgi:hypothetical protein
MAMVSVHIKVKDFGEWRKSFDKDKAARDKVGIISEIISFRMPTIPTMSRSWRRPTTRTR